MQVQTFPITLVKSQMLSERVKHFVFKATKLPSFDFTAGQFITIHFIHEGKSYKRSYSIANIPLQDNYIEFAAGFVSNGPGTTLLYQLKPNDIIHINGPFGRLILREPMPKRLILIATSTGITPYRAMLNELRQKLNNNNSLSIIILQGVQTVKDILYADEFNALACEYPNRVTFSVYLSRPVSLPLPAYCFKGYVQHSFADLNLNPDNDRVYLCGNPAMIDESFILLKDQGFALSNIIREKYISN